MRLIKYFVIINYEDGPTVSGPWTKARLLEHVKEDFNELTYLDKIEEFFLNFESFPVNTAVIIKGSIVTPFTKEVAVKYDID
jgi:hypothetical protein